MNAKITITALIIILGLGGWGYYEKSKDKTSSEPIKIGIASLLSGDYAVVGENIRDTAQLVIDNINKEGGVDGRQIEIIVEDSKLSSKDGLSAVTKLATVDQVHYLIAGMASNGTIAGAPIINKERVVSLVPVTGGANIDGAGEYVFRIANSDILAGQALAKTILKQNLKNVAIVNEITDYTSDLKNGFKKEFLAGGGTIVAEEDYQPGATDFRTVVTKIKSSSPSALLVLSQTGLSSAYFLKQAREQKINLPIFTDFTLVTNSDAKKIAGSFEGLYFADPAYDNSSPNWHTFEKAFAAKYGHPPIIPFHSAATYDSIILLTQAIGEVGDDPVKVHDWLLKNVKNYTGLLGQYSLDPAGNSNNGFIVKVMTGDQFIKVEN